jgi:hypothetical protein
LGNAIGHYKIIVIKDTSNFLVTQEVETESVGLVLVTAYIALYLVLD